ncbi:hypothetical protein GCM10020366_42700 [Saccharopolyspora gregorii]|uniref:Uncharacterized protein n=1 Tax=Saccharopolyspora gregorii TaxID=33914 RepID=A0ABP6RSN1_9PSEU
MALKCTNLAENSSDLSDFRAVERHGGRPRRSQRDRYHVARKSIKTYRPVRSVLATDPEPDSAVAVPDHPSRAPRRAARGAMK